MPGLVDARVDDRKVRTSSQRSRVWAWTASTARDPVVSAAVSVWLLSRICVLVFMILGAHLTVYGRDEEEGIYGAAIRLGDPSQVVARLQQTVLVADAGWYYAIAESGYEAIPFDTEQQRSWRSFRSFHCCGAQRLGSLASTRSLGWLCHM